MLEFKILASRYNDVLLLFRMNQFLVELKYINYLQDHYLYIIVNIIICRALLVTPHLMSYPYTLTKIQRYFRIRVHKMYNNLFLKTNQIIDS